MSRFGNTNLQHLLLTGNSIASSSTLPYGIFIYTGNSVIDATTGGAYPLSTSVLASGVTLNEAKDGVVVPSDGLYKINLQFANTGGSVDSSKYPFSFSIDGVTGPPSFTAASGASLVKSLSAGDVIKIISRNSGTQIYDDNNEGNPKYTLSVRKIQSH